jgi:hypothetical protein
LKFYKNKKTKAEFTIEKNNCSSFLLIHPTKRNIVVVGDENGSIEIFDINFENKNYIKKFECQNDYKYHSSKIVFLDWMKIKIGDKNKLVILKDFGKLV